VGCESAEHNYSEGQAGDVFEATGDKLTQAIRDGLGTISDVEAMEIEVALLQLPRRAALALRLHYVGYPRITANQRRRILGVSIDKYHELLDNSAGALASLLSIDRKQHIA
jgi:hypothetical protein